MVGTNISSPPQGRKRVLDALPQGQRTPFCYPQTGRIQAEVENADGSTSRMAACWSITFYREASHHEALRNTPAQELT